MSKREGLPVSVMESLSVGIAVIWFDRGNNDLIINKYNGFLIKRFEDIPNIITYLNLNNNYFGKIQFNAIRSIKKSFSKKEINSYLYNIFRTNFNKFK